MDIKARYIDILTNEVWKDSKSMIDYSIKKTGYIIPLEGGDMAIIEKPTIQTAFCFGYGYCGVSTEEDYEGAHGMVKHARTNEQYFIDKNLEDINHMIDELSNPSNVIYKAVKFSTSPDNSNLKSIFIVEKWTDPKEDFHYSNYRSIEKCTDHEKAEILKGYEEVKKAFTKRLNTYLKRYGLSKIKAWSYLVD